MSKTWQPSQHKQFVRQLRLGDTYYVILNIAHAKFTSWGEDQLYSEIVFTGRLPFTGTPCTANGYSADDFCRLYGPVYDTQPRGLHNIADRPPNLFKPERTYGGQLLDWV
ncbi:hypothetical protein [Streptomyces sp. NPDC101249]|uniref:hypothetical protein n=1 Tax=Streptomyces sp. NPDC101249 TaxID=3366140 RepID=UPI00380BA30B